MKLFLEHLSMTFGISLAIIGVICILYRIIIKDIMEARFEEEYKPNKWILPIAMVLILLGPIWAIKAHFNLKDSYRKKGLQEHRAVENPNRTLNKDPIKN